MREKIEEYSVTENQNLVRLSREFTEIWSTGYNYNICV
jgi:hypothetical protein